MSLQAGNTEELDPAPAPAPEVAESRPPEIEAIESSPPKVELPEPEAGANDTETTSRVSSDASATYSSQIPQGTLVSSQPGPISQPSLTFNPKLSTHQRNPPAFLRILTVTLVILKIIFVYAIPGSIFVVLIFVLSLALPLGFVAGNGAAVMVIGNAILNKAHVPGYTSNANAAAIGATGAVIAVLIIGTFLSCFAPCLPCLSSPREPENYDFPSMGVEQQQEPSSPWYIRFFVSLLTFTLGGVLGWAILRHNHVNLGSIDATHVARAAALGSVLLSVGAVFAGPILLAAIGIILSPLWVAMAMGLKWVHIHSNESWEQRGNWTITRSSYCYCYGFCGRDEEIDAELAKIGH